MENEGEKNIWCVFTDIKSRLKKQGGKGVDESSGCTEKAYSSFTGPSKYNSWLLPSPVKAGALAHFPLLCFFTHMSGI